MKKIIILHQAVYAGDKLKIISQEKIKSNVYQTEATGFSK